ncbi:MAG: hypothetical protein GKR99_16670 [Rhodobacteraceae bacterium]|nr:hypothetical protein [Paracoccaceae bacterium]
MSAPLPSALRIRFHRYIEEGLSGRAAALRLKLSPATGARWARQVRMKGHAEPARQGPPRGKGKLAPHREFFEELIAPWVIKGAIDGPAFAAYIREVLVPEINPCTVVILDNLATHRNKEATQALRNHGCWFLYLPPYSPDLNPIEQAFSKLKAHLRRIGARSFTQVFEAIGAICDLYDPVECWNYFKAAGYVSG